MAPAEDGSGGVMTPDEPASVSSTASVYGGTSSLERPLDPLGQDGIATRPPEHTA